MKVSSSPSPGDWKSPDQMAKERRAEVDGTFERIIDNAISQEEKITGLQEGVYFLVKLLGEKAQEAWERTLVGPHNRIRTVADGARVETPGTYKFLTSETSPDREGYERWLREKLVIAELKAESERRKRIKAEKALKVAQKAANKALGLHQGPGQ